MNDYVFRIEDVYLKEGNDNFLVFEGYCTQSMNKFRIEYCGTEANNVGAASVPEIFIQKLKEALQEDYGYPPFKEKTVKKIFEDRSKQRYGFDW